MQAPYGRRHRFRGWNNAVHQDDTGGRDRRFNRNRRRGGGHTDRSQRHKLVQQELEVEQVLHLLPVEQEHQINEEHEVDQELEKLQEQQVEQVIEELVVEHVDVNRRFEHHDEHDFDVHHLVDLKLDRRFKHHVNLNLDVKRRFKHIVKLRRHPGARTRRRAAVRPWRSGGHGRSQSA